MTELVYTETLAAAALVRLRAAVAAASGSDPLVGLNIPDTTHEKLDDAKWPFLLAEGGDERGASISRGLPSFAAIGTVALNGLVGAADDDKADLNTRTSAIAAAVRNVLLQDSTFLQLFAWVDRCDTTYEDVAVGAAALAGRLFKIEIDLGYQVDYEPAPIGSGPVLVDIGLKIADPLDPGLLVSESGTIIATGVPQPLLPAAEGRQTQIFVNQGENRMAVNLAGGFPFESDALWVDPGDKLAFVSDAYCSVSGTAGDRFSLLVSANTPGVVHAQFSP